MIHLEWAQRAGIPLKIAEFVNRSIDYGSDWAFYDDAEEESSPDIHQKDHIIFRQLIYFYNKDTEHKYYVKACYLHHLLDYFRETHVNIYNLELVFRKYLQSKVISKISTPEGEIISFHDIISDIFELLRVNQTKLYDDLKRNYTSQLD